MLTHKIKALCIFLINSIISSNFGTVNSLQMWWGQLRYRKRASSIRWDRRSILQQNVVGHRCWSNRRHRRPSFPGPPPPLRAGPPAAAVPTHRAPLPSLPPSKPLPTIPTQNSQHSKYLAIKSTPSSKNAKLIMSDRTTPRTRWPRATCGAAPPRPAGCQRIKKRSCSCR